MVDPKMGYFILYKSDDSFFSRQIEKKQRACGFSKKHSRYIHVEVSGGGDHSVRIFPPISKLINIKKAHKGRQACIVRYKHPDYTIKRYKVAYFSACLCNKGYDIPGILSFLFKWIKQSNRLYFCSEGCAWALQKVFVEAFQGLHSSEIMPAHFLSEDEFEVFWEGEIT